MRIMERPVAKGIRFARLARCLALAAKHHRDPEVIARTLYRGDARVLDALKNNVLAGSTANDNWAGALVGDETNIYADFAEFLRPMTILGKFGQAGIPSLRRIPFRVPLLGQTAGGSGYWVGEGKPKPLTSLGFERTTLQPAKVANIAVVTQELLESASPQADVIVRDALAAALLERMDRDFVDPDKGVDAGVSPASITNGLVPIASSGNDADAIREDVRQIMAAFAAANNPPTSGVWIMGATTALALMLLRNALSQREFPDITMAGGTFEGLPVIVSEHVPTVTAGGMVILVNAQDIYFSDEGGADVEMSTQASLQMLDNPTNDSVTPTPTPMVSLWQTNSVAFKAERTVNWARRRDSGVQYLENVQWGQPGT